MAQTDVRLEWNESAYRAFMRDPDGPVGREIMRVLGDVVLAGARRRALRRTGHMIDSMYREVGVDTRGVYCDIASPARDPRSGFPYPVTHEGRRVRDRRPHRSLRPALRDIERV